MKLISIILLIIYSSLSHSLKCSNRQSIEERVSNANDIFVGQVTSIKTVEKLKAANRWPAKVKAQVDLKVIEVLKGNERKTQLVKFSYKPEIGGQYIIFNNNAFTSGCYMNYAYKYDSQTAEKIFRMFK